MEKTCGNCYWMMMQPGHGECGACGNPLCNEAHDTVAYSEGFYEYTTVDGDCGGEYWKEKTDTLEQRYAQLEKTLKEMWRWVRKTAYAEQGYLTVSELKEYARQFKECGVILDD